MFIMLYKVVLAFENVDDTLTLTIQMKVAGKYLPCGAVCYVVQGGYSF